MQHPVDNIKWVSHEELQANDWNPNHVLTPEFRLLKRSILESGWIQPVLVSKDEGDELYTIIDGFHRATLVKTDKEVSALTDGKLPICVMDLTKPQRMLLTVRINRAKGTHQAILMHELVKALVEEHGVSIDEIAEGIGGNRHEVETLLLENVFQKFDTKNHTYSRAWMPK